MLSKKQQKRKQAYKPRYSTNFAKKVLNVVNKKTEVKQHTYEPAGTNLVDNTLTTWNMNATLGQGTTTTTRIGDKIFIKNLRLRSVLQNWNRSSGTATSFPVLFRVIVFRGKYDYLTSSYPASEVFERNAGTSPTNLISARIDQNQVSCFYDKIFTINAAETALKHARVVQNYIKMNKTFKYRDDDAYGQTSNLYFGIVAQNTYDTLHTSSVDLMNLSFSFTDV